MTRIGKRIRVVENLIVGVCATTVTLSSAALLVSPLVGWGAGPPGLGDS